MSFFKNALYGKKPLDEKDLLKNDFQIKILPGNTKGNFKIGGHSFKQDLKGSRLSIFLKGSSVSTQGAQLVLNVNVKTNPTEKDKEQTFKNMSKLSLIFKHILGSVDLGVSDKEMISNLNLIKGKEVFIHVGLFAGINNNINSYNPNKTTVFNWIKCIYKKDHETPCIGDEKVPSENEILNKNNNKIEVTPTKKFKDDVELDVEF